MIIMVIIIESLKGCSPCSLLLRGCPIARETVVNNDGCKLFVIRPLRDRVNSLMIALTDKSMEKYYWASWGLS
jgi:hypothetical protein